MRPAFEWNYDVYEDPEEEITRPYNAAELLASLADVELLDEVA